MVTIELVREKTVRKSSVRSEADSLREAIELARSGEAAAARVMLVAVCRQNKECELGWFWLAAVARNPNERLACIKQVLRVNPANVSAREWLRKLRDMGIEQPDPAVPAPAKPAEPEPVAAVEAAASEEAPKTSSADVARLSEAVENETELPAAAATDTMSVEAPDPEPESCMDAAPAPQQDEQEAAAELPATETAAPVSVSSAFPSLYEDEPRVAPADEPAVETASAAPMAEEAAAAPEAEPEMEIVVEAALAPVVQYVSAPSASNLTDHTFPHVDHAAPAEPPPFPAPATVAPSITAEYRLAEISRPESAEPPPQLAVSAESVAYAPPKVIAGALLPHKPQLDTLAQLPVVETAAAVAPVAAPAEPDPSVPRCAICEAALSKPEYCGSCKSMNWPKNPLDFVLNRNVDHELLQGVIDRLQGVTCTAENELRIALAYCNLHQFDRARHHLERAAILDFETVSDVLERVAGFLQRPTVLVVDDSATIREVLIRMLGRELFLPIPIGNAWEVVAVAKLQRPAVILLDVTMPLVDGYEVCRQIRADRDTKSIPVVMVSGHTDLIDKVVAKLAGASDYLNKPFSPDQLMNTVRFYAGKKR